MDQDKGYADAFARVIALDHPGCSVTLRGGCGGCRRGADVCLAARGAAEDCQKRLLLLEGEKDAEAAQGEKTPAVWKYAGAAHILAASRRLAMERRAVPAAGAAGGEPPVPDASLPEDLLACFFAKSGGVGTSCAAIGAARELSRYRGRRTLYLSLEEKESEALFPPEAGGAMRAEAFLFQYLQKRRGGAGALRGLLETAAAQDGYGVYRLAPDARENSLSSLTAGEVLALLAQLRAALSLDKIVLDFGTRLRMLRAFTDICEAALVEVSREGLPAAAEDGVAAFANPDCAQDVRRMGSHTEIGLAGAFGLAVKQCCDRLLQEVQS